MTSRTPALRGAKRIGNAARVAATNGRKTGELAVAAGRVVAKRVSLGAAAAIDPLNADHAEFARMVPEKTIAFSQAGMTSLRYSGEVAQRVASYAASEMAAMAAAAVAIAGCRTSAGIVAAQSRFSTAWFTRALSQSIALGSLAMRSQGAAMAPIHRTATANARRLSR
jgi:hypothetical protein